MQNEEGKIPEHQPRDKEEEIRLLERRLSLLKQQGCYPIDTKVEVIEPDTDKKERAYQRKTSFLTDSYAESEEITPLKSQTKLDQRSVTQRLEDQPPVKEYRFTDDTNRIQYETDERASHYGYLKSNEVRNELQQKEMSTPVQRRDVRAKERQNHYIQPPEEAAYTNRTQYHRHEDIEQTEQRAMSSNRFQDDKGEHSLLIQRRKVEDNLRAWEEELRRKETELIEREERLAFQERRRQEACQLREKEQELRRRMELLQIREHKLAQGEARMRNEIYEAEQSPVKKDVSQEKNYPSAVISNRKAVREEKSEFEQHSSNEEHPLDLSQKRTYQREGNFNREIKREAVQHTLIKPEVEQHPLAEDVSKRYVQGDIKSNRGPTADTVNRKEIAYMSHCQNSSKFLSIAYFMKTADVIMFFYSSHDRTNHTC